MIPRGRKQSVPTPEDGNKPRNGLPILRTPFTANAASARSPCRRLRNAQCGRLIPAGSPAPQHTCTAQQLRSPDARCCRPIHVARAFKVQMAMRCIHKSPMIKQVRRSWIHNSRGVRIESVRRPWRLRSCPARRGAASSSEGRAESAYGDRRRRCAGESPDGGAQARSANAEVTVRSDDATTPRMGATAQVAAFALVTVVDAVDASSVTDEGIEPST